MFSDFIYRTRFLLLIFFFSSRRRHTRLQGDWSSDVCSSDLDRPKPDLDDEEAGELADLRVLRKAKANYAGTGDRSEERRVGKECRSRREACQYIQMPTSADEHAPICTNVRWNYRSLSLREYH